MRKATTAGGGLLSRPYFSGGTVDAAIPDSHFHKPRRSVSGRFEDGTISFLAIAALPFGLDQLARLGMEQVSRHTAQLAALAYTGLKQLRHAADGGGGGGGADGQQPVVDVLH